MAVDDYPHDSDGDALRRVTNDGSDMSKPMDIDFAVSVPDEDSAQRTADVAGRRGYATEIYRDDEEDSWTVYCTKPMVATYEAIGAAEDELDELSGPFGGFTDGWGTFGNANDG